MGYYDRGVTDESGEDYRIDIARYLCRKKGPIQAHHCTFSLLPHPLIPYFSHTIELTLEAISFWVEGHSISEVQDFLCGFGQKEPLEMGISTLYRLREVVEDAFERTEEDGSFEDFIGCCKDFHCLMEGNEFFGPSALSLDYYLRNEGRFLFGRPSQQRIQDNFWRQRKYFSSDTQPRYPP
jgi:hypothetical protein